MQVVPWAARMFQVFDVVIGDILQTWCFGQDDMAEGSLELIW